MKKLWVVGAAVVIIAGTGVALVATSGKDKGKSTEGMSVTDMQHGVTLGKKDACAILTPDIAVKVLDEGAQKGTVNAGASSDDVSVSSCTYTSKTDNSLESVRNMRTATLLVRAPLTKAGADSNSGVFHPIKSGALEISGYGDMAFWDPEFGQLNVLKDGVWYIVSIGKTAASDHIIDEAKAFAGTLGLADTY